MNIFSSEFKSSLRQVQSENSSTANEIYNIAKFHLPQTVDRLDCDSGYVDSCYARRAITRQVRLAMPTAGDPEDLSAAHNWVIVYQRMVSPPGFYVRLLLHNRDLVHYIVIGLCRP